MTKARKSGANATRKPTAKAVTRSSLLRIGYQLPTQGYCMGCSASTSTYCGPILHINAGNWITRLCDKCVDQLIADVVKYRAMAKS